MTAREYFFTLWNTSVSEDENGLINEDDLAAFRDALYAEAADWTIVCPESYDSTISFEFDDGSGINLSNPYQKAFEAFIT